MRMQVRLARFWRAGGREKGGIGCLEGEGEGLVGVAAPLGEEGHRLAAGAQRVSACAAVGIRTRVSTPQSKPNGKKFNSILKCHI